MIMATAEIAVTIMAASIPVLRALFSDLLTVHAQTPQFYHEYNSAKGTFGNSRTTDGGLSSISEKPRKQSNACSSLSTSSTLNSRSRPDAAEDRPKWLDNLTSPASIHKPLPSSPLSATKASPLGSPWERLGEERKCCANCGARDGGIKPESGSRFL
jgi:hypothetical protein